ncbi:MAG TPA: serine hydrolase [Polyangia bacterium]|jgi:hypothetical protein
MRLARVALLLLLATAVGRAAAQRRSTLEERAAAIAALVRPSPGGWEQLFTREFLAQVPPPRLTAIFMDLHAKYGPVVKTVLVTREQPGAAQFELTLQRGFSVPLRLVVDAAAPHLVTGLLLGQPVRQAASLAEVAQLLRALPGEVSFLAARLDGARLEPLATVNPDRRLAIASGFKLWVLGLLVQDVEAGRRGFGDVIALEEQSRSLPSGILQTWPAGVPVTLHTLATLMITMSDNTATDQLVRTLGRERLEQHQARMGHGAPALNVPFLLTQEVFKLEGDPAGAAGPAYLARDVAGRRALLAGGVAALRLDRLVLAHRPKARDLKPIEWFASATDLGRALVWLRDHTGAPRTAPARALLGISPGTQLAPGRFQYVGYKGGTEPGICSMSYLLQSRRGAWYVLTAAWNAERAASDEGQLGALLTRAAQLLDEPARAGGSGSSRRGGR